MSILSIGELLDLGNSASTAGLIPYSALEYNGSGDISAISGSAIAGGVESSVVSSIVSSMVSGKADQSALDDCCSAMSAVVSAKLDASASSQFQPSGDYADASSLSSKLDASASGMFAPSGNYQSAGDYAFNSSLSSKLDASASSEFYLTSNPSGFVNSSYVESSISGKLDASASGNFAPSGDYAYNSSLSSYVNYSAISGEDSRITSIHGSAVGEAIPPLTTLVVDSATMSSVIDFDNKFYIGVKDGVFAGTGVASGKLDSSAFSSYSSDVDSAISGKLDQSAFSAYSAGVTVVQIVNNSSEATGSNILYVVTGSV